MEPPDLALRRFGTKPQERGGAGRQRQRDGKPGGAGTIGRLRPENLMQLPARQPLRQPGIGRAVVPLARLASCRHAA